jgi:REP element-mobilizing transposase RayT
MITFRLFDSLPKDIINKIETLFIGKPEAEKCKHIEAYLDEGKGSCFLLNPKVASMVEDALFHFDGDRYRLIAWVLMPNHVHALIETVQGFPLEYIVHSWKSYTAHEAVKILNHKGHFWQPDYFDRFIRNNKHLVNSINYIHFNPVKAGLVDNPGDWPFTSARYSPLGRL